MNNVSRRAGTLVLALIAGGAGAQSACSSDGQPPPTGLLERFINADCDGCWTDLRAPEPARGEVALDWIVPGSRDDDAPLAAAARRDGLDRLAALRRAIPRNEDTQHQQRTGPSVQLRVARGPAFNGYVGASIELQDGGTRPWRAWLLLVETLPAGSERTPVQRNLVRNVLQLDWNGKRAPGERLIETRAMNIPEGAQPARLQVVGWVEDARGRIRGIAQSRCAAP